MQKTDTLSECGSTDFSVDCQQAVYHWKFPVHFNFSIINELNNFLKIGNT